MTKKSLCSFVTFALASAICLISMHLMLLASVNQYVGVGVGGGILLVAFICFLIFSRKHKDSPFIPVFLPIASVACGLAISSLYIYLGAPPTVVESLCVWGAYLVLFLFYCLLTYIPFFRWHPYICITIYGLLVLAGGIVGICLSSPFIFSLALLIFILFISCLASLVASSHDIREHNFYLAWFYFMAMFIIVLIVLVVISGGDGADGLDLSPSGGTGYRRTKKNPYDFRRDV